MNIARQMTAQSTFCRFTTLIGSQKTKVVTVCGLVAITASLLGTTVQAQNRNDPSSSSADSGRKVKVMIVTMFGLEAKTWLDRLGPWKTIKVPGLAPDYPDVHCNRQDVCVMTTDMGHANAAASTMALAFTKQFDLRNTYFLVAGIAGIDPSQGTLGSPAWAMYLVEFSAQWEMDSREKPSDWPSGFVAVGSKTPDALPQIENHTEVFELNSELANAGFVLSQNVVLADSAEAKATRAKFTYAPANQPPKVLQCDTLSDDTWWGGDFIGERARTWTKQLTHGKGTYCTSQEEDNATFEAMKRAADAGQLDIKRVAVLRSGSDFDRPYKGQSASESLFSFQSAGGFAPAIENLYRAGYPLMTNIVDHWSAWVDGVPAQLPEQNK